MKISLVLLIAGATVSTCLSIDQVKTLPNELFLAEWQEFKTTHGKTYADAKEEDRRFQMYLGTRYAVAKHNHEESLGLHSYRQAVNKFADIETSEFLGSRPQHESIGDRFWQDRTKYSTESPSGNPPANVDWRDKNAVTPVKDQGTQCNAGYAFATIAGLESILAIKHNKTNLSLSEQQIIDCCLKGTKGCLYGNVFAAAKYLSHIDGAEGEKDYPYTGKYQGKCNYDTSKVRAILSCWNYGGKPTENNLRDEIMKGPEQVGIHVPDSLKQYSHGIFSDSECSKAKSFHYALVVGYGTNENDGDYWILKNSWGTNWGESGFFRMARNKGDMCDITSIRIQFCGGM